MLVKTGSGWQFESELALETLVAQHLDSLLSLQLLQRQQFCRGEICDLLATDSARRLVIVELKNVEDRYIVQQLTRYYDALSEERPLAEQIDYSQPPRLIAIAPSFHRHNLIDRSYSTLAFEFFSFTLVQEAERFWLRLRSVDTGRETALPLDFREVRVPVASDLPALPQRLIDAVGSLSAEAQQNLFELRQQILSFDSRIQEIVTAQSIGYGRGTQNWCVEFYFHKGQSTPILFLWLPIWRYRKRPAIGRHRIWADWSEALYLAHVPMGLGKARPLAEWNQIPREKWPRQQVEGGRTNLVAYSFHPNLATTLGCKEASKSLTAVVEVALKQWQARQ